MVRIPAMITGRTNAPAHENVSGWRIMAGTCANGPRTAKKTAQRIPVLLTLAIIALSGCIRIQPHSHFLPQTTLSGVTLGGSGLSSNASSPAAAINDTNCSADFPGLIPTDNRFDDRVIADWGDLDNGCDFYPQNENDFN